MKKLQILILAIIFSLILFSVFIFFNKFNLTGKSIQEPIYSFTKAICDNTSCQDYEIICKNNSAIKQTPITGKVFHYENWEDPRTDEERNRLCG